MTEEEAKTKWCPRANISNDSFKNTVASNRYVGGGIPEGCRCIASDCMMWESHDYYVNENGSAFFKDSDTEKRKHVTGGDCGLKSKEFECRGGF